MNAMSKEKGLTPLEVRRYFQTGFTLIELLGGDGREDI